MWDLFGWPVQGAVVLLLTGVGFSLMSTTPPEFEAAKWCFHVAALLLLVKTSAWLIGQQSGVVVRAGVAFLLFGITGSAWSVSVHWVQNRQRERLEAAGVPSPPEAALRFIPAYESYKAQLGRPISGEQSAGYVQQYAHEHAMVIWSEALVGFYKLPHDERPYQFEKDPTWDKHSEWSNEEELIKKFRPPKGKKPPWGGVASHWYKNPKAWRWIGWRIWLCLFPSSDIFFQKFEHGILIGPVRTQEELETAHIAVIFDDGSWRSVDFKGPIPVCGQP